MPELKNLCLEGLNHHELIEFLLDGVLPKLNDLEGSDRLESWSCLEGSNTD